MRATFLPLPPGEPRHDRDLGEQRDLSTPAPRGTTARRSLTAPPSPFYPCPQGNHFSMTQRCPPFPFLPLPPGEPRRARRYTSKRRLSTPAPRGTTLSAPYCFCVLFRDRLSPPPFLREALVCCADIISRRRPRARCPAPCPPDTPHSTRIPAPDAHASQ